MTAFRHALEAVALGELAATKEGVEWLDAQLELALDGYAKAAKGAPRREA